MTINGLTGGWPTGGSQGFREGYSSRDYSGAERLANDLRSKFNSGIAVQAMIFTTIAERGWKIIRKPFAQSGSTLRAISVPLLTGGFSLLVNDQYYYGQS